MRVLSMGEVLWDIFPQGELLGGAPLNFSAHLARLGHVVSVISAVGDDLHGARAQDAIQSLGVGTELIDVVPHGATGIAIIRIAPSGDCTFDIPRPAAFDEVGSSPDMLSRARVFDPDWIYFGTLAQTDRRVEQLTQKLVRSLPLAGCLYDLNLREGHWNMSLVHRLSQLASVLKMNQDEAEILSESIRMDGQSYSLDGFCKLWATKFNLSMICVTMGKDGCLIYEDGQCCRIAGTKVEVRDTVGAGDAFAAAFLHGFQLGWPILRAARFANALGGLVASRPGATPMWSIDECEEVVRQMEEAAATEDCATRSFSEGPA